MSKMFNSTDEFINKHLYQHLSILALCSILFLILYNFNETTFIATSKLLMFVMATYLLISSFATRHITQNTFLSYISIFYASINLLQGIQLVQSQFKGITINHHHLSLATYFVGRMSFAVMVVIISYVYLKKPEKLEQASSYIMCGFVLIAYIFIPLIMNETFIIFINSHTLKALFFNLFSNLFMPAALLLSFYKLYPLRSRFPYSHKVIIVLFLIVCGISELIQLIYFIPLSGPRIVPYLFKLSSLYLLIIGQIDCCILRPFSELYLKSEVSKKDMANTHQELYEYSLYAKQLENNLRLKTSHYERILSLFPEPFLLCIDDKILDANQAALELFHCVNKHDLAGNSLLTYLNLPPTLLEEYKSLPDHPGKLLKGEGSLTTFNDETYHIEYLFTTTYLHESINIVCILRNITEKKQKVVAEKALEQQNLKLSYFSNISHDIKMPINIIYSALQMQAHATNLDECLHYTDMMRSNSLRLLKLINNILDITKLDNNMVNLSAQVFNIVDAVETLCEMSYFYMEEKNINYVFDTNVDEKLIFIDPAAFERIIFNLLSNAIKYTPHGGHLYINMYDLDDAIQIVIKDTGIGVAPDKLEHIFGRFITAEQGTSSKEHSCGIGLSIVRDLIHLMRGTITCESTLGEGATFTVTLLTPSLGDIEIDYPYQATYTPHNIKIEFSGLG